MKLNIWKPKQNAPFELSVTRMDHEFNRAAIVWLFSLGWLRGSFRIDIRKPRKKYRFFTCFF